MRIWASWMNQPKLSVFGPCRSGHGVVGGPTRWHTLLTIWLWRLVVSVEWGVWVEEAR
jgi:hypothetical protein